MTSLSKAPPASGAPTRKDRSPIVMGGCMGLAAGAVVGIGLSLFLVASKDDNTGPAKPSTWTEVQETVLSPDTKINCVNLFWHNPNTGFDEPVGIDCNWKQGQ